MTELYIDKQPVVLPADFDFELIQENTFFTKKGKYSLELELSLKDRNNAKLYKHLNRINNRIAIPENRQAYLVVDNDVVLNGTEIINEITDSAVKIQLASGESELNFLSSDKKIRDLDLGSATPYTGTPNEIAAKITSDMILSYPERDWQLVPYATQSDISPIENWMATIPYIGNCYNFHQSNYPYFRERYGPQVPQPYLCFIIKKIIESFGYHLEFNFLANDFLYKNLYIVHGIQTLEFAKMLPDWTVSEFFTKLETLFGCVILVDEHTKNVKIIAINNLFDIEKQYIEPVDEYQRTIDKENNLLIKNSNIAYDFDDENYYKFMDIGEILRKKAWPVNDFYKDRFIEDFLLYMSQHPILVSPATIYQIREDRFIIYNLTELGFTIRKVDSFRPLMNNPDSEEIDIKSDIIPASMAWTKIRRVSTDGFHYIQVPIAGYFTPLKKNPNETEDYTPFLLYIQNEIENGAKEKEEKLSTVMRLAIYDGILRALDNESDSTRTYYYPIAYVEGTPEYIEAYKKTSYINQVNPFRLDYLQKNL